MLKSHKQRWRPIKFLPRKDWLRIY